MKLLNLFTALFASNLNSFRCYFLKSTELSNRATRQSTDNTHLSIPRYCTNKVRKCFNYQGVKVWNSSIPQEIRSFSFRKFILHYKELASAVLQLDSLRDVLEPFLVIEPFDKMRPFLLWRARVLKIHNGHNSLYHELKFSGKISDFHL